MKLPPDSLPLPIAAFRAWETPERIASIPLRLTATHLDVAAERPKAAGDRYGWSATEFNRESVQVTTTWTSIWVDPPREKIAWAESPDERIISKALWDLLDDHETLDSNAVYDINRKARSLWDEVIAGMFDRLLRGDETAYAREGSPVAGRFTKIPASAWRQLSIEDWGTGTAISDGGQPLFDIYLVGPGKPVGKPVMVGPASQAIVELYPDGRYPDRKSLAKEVAAHMGKLTVSPSTVDRALREVRGRS
tara:strand:+ start:1614 stop:2363 length:750 start_codon:yes stop_codon:yes gene_type:complete